MKKWNELSYVQKCFNGLSKEEILSKEYYNLLKEGKDFRTKNGTIEFNISDDYTANINFDDFIITYSHKDIGILIKCSNRAYIAFTYEDFNKGYEYIMSIWEE